MAKMVESYILVAEIPYPIIYCKMTNVGMELNLAVGNLLPSTATLKSKLSCVYGFSSIYSTVVVSCKHCTSFKVSVIFIPSF